MSPRDCRPREGRRAHRRAGARATAVSAGRVALAAGLAGTITMAASGQATPPAPVASSVAPATYLLAGAMLPDRGPDGNTVVLQGRDGLVVIDTGRHPWHSDGILALARERQAPIVAIVNTHWHLDHASGNRRVKAVHPRARLYATPAVDAAIAPDGFLGRNVARARERVNEPGQTPVQREERALFLETMAASAALRPEVPVSRSGRMTLAGRPLEVHVTDHAVTAADLWIHDRATGVVVLGDLVTLPAPFFETACPARWQEVLDEVWRTPFETAIPGHGAPMTRKQFDTYRQAFAAFRTCVGGTATAAACASAWTRDVGAFLPSEADRAQASEYAAYYVDFLRKGGGASPDCARP